MRRAIVLGGLAGAILLVHAGCGGCDGATIEDTRVEGSACVALTVTPPTEGCPRYEGLRIQNNCEEDLVFLERHGGETVKKGDFALRAQADDDDEGLFAKATIGAAPVTIRWRLVKGGLL